MNLPPPLTEILLTYF